MTEPRPFQSRDWFALSVVLLLGLALRCGYLLACTDYGQGKAAWQVQGDGPPLPALSDGAKGAATEQEDLIARLRDQNWFGGRSPLADEPEETAALSPGYPWLLAMLGRFDWPADAVVRWLQCVLGAVSAGLYFLLARRLFSSLVVGFLAGMLTAGHPYWIVNCAELADGALAGFLLALCLYLGTRGAAKGGPFTCVAFGIGLAALAMVRAAFLPFALIALLWFLPQCRTLKHGWSCALLAFLGFANGLGPWLVRNVQAFQAPLPIVSAVWLHLWMGNNPRATGSALSEDELRASLPPETRDRLLREPNQARRYNLLARETIQEVIAYPGDTLNRRIMAGTVFLLGEPWLQKRSLALKLNAALDRDVAAAPEWIDQTVPGLLAASLLWMSVLGLYGWRASWPWRHETRLLLLAVVFLPLPYLLGHTGVLVGPRLPLDGVWLTFGAVGLARILGRKPITISA
jgi:4-amino-4-deoxy-L-arabinose transferase-like glycosyltransferase